MKDGFLDYTPPLLFPISEAELAVALSRTRFLKNALQLVPEAILTALWDHISHDPVPEVTGIRRLKSLLSTRAQALVEALDRSPKALLAEALAKEGACKREQTRIISIGLKPSRGRTKDPIEVKTPGELALMIASLYAFRKEYILLEKLYQRSEFHTHNEYREPLVFYASFGHLEKVQSLLMQQHRPNVLSFALKKASKNGYVAVVRELLREAFNQEEGIPREGKYSALAMASERGHLKVVQLFLEADVVDSLSLLIAAQNGYTAIVQELLKQERKTGVLFDKGKALQKACIGGHLEVLSLLLTEDVPVEDKALSLYYAAGLGKLAVVQKLMNRVGEEVRDYTLGCCAVAAENGHLEVVQLLTTSVAENTFLSDISQVKRSLGRP